MDSLKAVFASENYLLIVIVVTVALVFWFLPAALALIFNRKHFKLIFLACIPAGFSFIAWSGVLIWAVTGKLTDKSSDREKPET